MTSPEHDETVRTSFRRQADEFSRTDSVYATPNAANRWIAPLDAGMVALEVACGAAHAAEAASPFVRQVIGIDITVELLAIGAGRLQAAGVDNVLLQDANAHALPFVDQSFDLVFCRSSLHHFADPQLAVDEMVRVCRRGGRVALNDLVAPSADIRDHFDHVHRLLDPSHVRTFVESELVTLLAERATITDHETARMRLPLEVAFSNASQHDAVMATLTSEMTGGATTGFEPANEDGTLVVSFPITSLQATIT